jgi:hypothetical protein
MHVIRIQMLLLKHYLSRLIPFDELAGSLSVFRDFCSSKRSCSVSGIDTLPEETLIVVFLSGLYEIRKSVTVL